MSVQFLTHPETSFYYQIIQYRPDRRYVSFVFCLNEYAQDSDDPKSQTGGRYPPETFVQQQKMRLLLDGESYRFGLPFIYVYLKRHHQSTIRHFPILNPPKRLNFCCARLFSAGNRYFTVDGLRDEYLSIKLMQQIQPSDGSQIDD